MSALCENLNHRHLMAQLAGRASVSLHTNIFFKARARLWADACGVCVCVSACMCECVGVCVLAYFVCMPACCSAPACARAAQNKVIVESALVMRLRANGVVVLVPRFGIEGTVFVVGRRRDGGAPAPPRGGRATTSIGHVIVVCSARVREPVRVR